MLAHAFLPGPRDAPHHLDGDLHFTVMQVVAKLISENWSKITNITEKWSKMAFSEHFLVNWTCF